MHIISFSNIIWKVKQKSKSIFFMRYIFLVSSIFVYLVTSAIYLQQDDDVIQVKDEIISKRSSIGKAQNLSYKSVKYLIEEEDFCHRGKKYEIIGYVHSVISRAENRRVTRETWANATNNIAVIFVVGLPKNDEERKLILHESRVYKDILQVDLSEDYHLLSYKGLSALSWISHHCQHVPWTLHADDDVLVDIFLLTMNLRSYDIKTTDHFYCNAMYSKAMREGKWAVSYEEYPAVQYPVFCSGGMWVLPTKVIPRLLKASEEVPFLWVDDAYVTGVLAERANVSRHGDPDGYGSDIIRTKDIGIYHAWHSIKGDRKYWWKKIVRIYANLIPE
ncbi:beta-1,3-galactosyltransferase 2-like [Palaemon carinicauda]|uniref:beta-1,3-galactosyltransferase 2-like n=1 Tax=Palaemon carinicauda TaxID=392227 RepID=UPI0035B6775A